MDLLSSCVSLARRAGAAIMAVYRSDFSVRYKGDASPLTEADLAAHRILVEGLKQLTPEVPVLSEEGADIPFSERCRWTRHWLIDPLDGTKEFVRRNGEFTVNIALIENQIPVLGVVHAPALDLDYGAATGEGAFQWQAGGRQALRCRPNPARLKLLVSRSHHDAAAGSLWQSRLPEHDSEPKGSSLKFCMIAAGQADLHVRSGPTSEWDTAAGQCLVEQAGGRVVNFTSPLREPLRYNQKESLINPAFAVCGAPEAAWSRFFVQPPSSADS